MRDNKTTPDGREIVAREPASGPHPRFPEKIVPYRTINQLLLTDESTVYECDRCGKVHANFRSILSHQPSHGERPPSLYDEKTLRAIAVAVRRNWTDKRKFHLAADELNEKKVPTARAEGWNGNMIRQLFNHHCQDIRVHIRRSKPDPTEPVSAPPVNTPVPPDLAASPVAVIPPDIATIQLGLADLASKLEALTAYAWRLREAVGKLQTTDPELVDKAARYDQMFAAFHRPNRPEADHG